MKYNLKEAQLLANNVFLFGSYPEDFYISEIVNTLVAADDLYHNGKESFITDEQYDTLREYTEKSEPHHSYFTGVGSEVRGGKIKLPYPMGSLDQVNMGEVEDWISKWNLYDETLVVTEKLDGTSAMVVYDSSGQLQIAYSRGNGIEGADITRHLKQFILIPPTTKDPFVIRGEVILTRSGFKALREIVKSRSGKPYKNARNMVAGLMNAESNPSVVYEYLHFIAYEIVNFVGTKEEMFGILLDNDFQAVYGYSEKGSLITSEALVGSLNHRRDHGEYEIDGVVIDVNNYDLRKIMVPTRETLNPVYAVKFKVADADNQATAAVEEVEWNVSKHGYLKPRVRITPVDLQGVTITYATGFNANFIKENNIGPGATIQITRSGDVIPFIQGVVKGTEAQLPDEELTWQWNESGVDIVLIDPTEFKEVIIRQVIYFFTTLDVPNLKEGTVSEMFELHNYKDFIHAASSMIHYTEDHWVSCIGVNGKKVYQGIIDKLNGIPLYQLMGATPFFGHGVGVRKMKKIQKKMGIVDFLLSTKIEELIHVEGIEEITASKIIKGMDVFLKFMEGIEDKVKLADENSSDDGIMKDQKVVFTGFRDKELSALVEQEGGTIQTGVSKKTTILVTKEPDSTSGKAKKARDYGVRVMGIDEFKEMLL